jgi:iron complex outermembrane receptor protein
MAGDTVTLQGDVSKGSHGQRVNIASFSPPSQIPIDGDLDAFGMNVLARWQRDFASGRGFRLQASFDRTSWVAPHFEERRNTLDVDFIHHTTVGRRHTVTAGAGVRVSPSRFTQVVPTLDFTPRRETSSVYSGFAQDEVTLLRDRLWLTAGSKIEHNNYTGVELQPDVRLLWTPRPGHSAWTALTRAVRTPSRIENAIVSTSYSSTTTVPIYLRVTGNPDFDAERTTGYEAGYRTRLGGAAYVDVAAFHAVHHGLGSFGLGRVTLEQTPAPLHAVADVLYVNGVNGTSDGVELSPDVQLRRWWQLRGSYSYVRFDLANTPGSIDVNAVNRYSGSSPHHQVRLESHLNLPAGGEFDAAYRYAGALPAQKVPAYHTVDARVGWAISRRSDVSVAGQNLLSPFHAEFGHSQGQPVGIARTLYIDVRFHPVNARR